MEVIAIAARSANNIIGVNNALPWPTNKQDLNWFKTLTMGDPMILGRTTFDSLPGILPGRHHYVVTTNPERCQNRPNVTFFNPFDKKDVLTKLEADGHQRVFIIGGNQVYSLFAPYCTMLMLRTFNKDAKPLGKTVEFPMYRFDGMKLIMREQWDDSITETYVKVEL